MQMTATQRGIFALTLGIAIFSIQDVILKLLSGDYPLQSSGGSTVGFPPSPPPAGGGCWRGAC
jgi:hypothetical protein